MPKTPLPSLFGRVTAILSDHHDISVLLGRLEETCAALEAPGPAPPQDLAPGPLIARLLADLVEHFRAEESDGYFGVMVRDRPAIEQQIGVLCAEHAAMLETLRALHAAAEGGRWRELPSPMRGFIAALRRHEAAESQLMQAFFSLDESGADED